MKRIIIFIAVFSLGLFSGQYVKYGVTANFHKGSIVGVHDVSKGKFGGSLGIFVQIPLVENDVFDSANLYLVPQIEYSMQGENADAEEVRFNRQKFHHDYIAAQLYIKWFYSPNGYKSDLFLFGGPTVEFLVRENRTVDPAYDLVYYKYNLDDKVNNFGFGASIGVGYKVSDRIETFLRFDRGFSKVYPNNDLRNTYNRLLGVGINYYIGNGY